LCGAGGLITVFAFVIIVFFVVFDVVIITILIIVWIPKDYLERGVTGGVCTVG
jgi:hypothetical protein